MENPLEQRVKDLEQQLADLKKVVAKLSPEKRQEPQPPTPVKKTENPFISPPINNLKKEIKAKVKKDQTQSSEKWLGRLGIGLLLFGAVFLFKYSIDQGWITPLVRVLFGIGLGIILFIFGLRLYDRNKMLSRLLLGGGIATYYITIFSAFQLYGLISHGMAFAFMILVTISAFLLALRQDEPVLSLIGIIGGLLTPFLLYTGESNIPGLASYTSLLIIGSSVTYMKRGWRALLWVTSWGGWIVWSISVYNLPASEFGYLLEKWSVQIGIIITWLSLWALPVYREFLHLANPEKWPNPNLDTLDNRVSRQFADFVRRHLYFLSLSTPIVGMVLVPIIWSFSKETTGWIIMALSLVYFWLFIKYRLHDQLKNLFYLHGLTATLLLTWSFLLIFDGNTQFFVLATESWILFLIAERTNDSKLRTLSKVFISVMGFVLLIRLFTLSASSPFIFNRRSLTDLGFILMLGHSAYLIRNHQQSILNFAFMHIGIMGWLLRELQGFDNGQALVTTGWGILALIVFVFGLRNSKVELRYLGSATIFIVVGKLFIVDLSELETIWRIILFIGFGGLLLIVSNYLSKLISKPKETNEPEK
ncbi:MAG: DUF2339 domain-containing protein [Calditrichaeota bacterium]|nr:MAG: DUF2339 domain-containing protein [Calditrichota bacterium]MBL1204811.1 DUF2339 domain-containing protein [Calditrichota bacterium]NOG44640.1 DUF2339 domain-containing protein [Calditrichota bacterium]